MIGCGNSLITEVQPVVILCDRISDRSLPRSDHVTEAHTGEVLNQKGIATLARIQATVLLPQDTKGSCQLQLSAQGHPVFRADAHSGPPVTSSKSHCMVC